MRTALVLQKVDMAKKRPGFSDFTRKNCPNARKQDASPNEADSVLGQSLTRAGFALLIFVVFN